MKRFAFFMVLILIGCQSDSTSSSISKVAPNIQEINISVKPEISFMPGSELAIIDYGKFTIKYDDGSSEERAIDLDNTPEMDIFANNYRIQYLQFQANTSLDLNAIVVNNSVELASALTSETILVLIKTGEYQLTAGNSTYVKKDKYLLGEENTNITITGQVASQAAIIFTGVDVTLQNLSFNADTQKANIKIINSEKAYLKNVNAIGGGGLDVYGSKLLIDETTITVEKSFQTAALKISLSDITIINSHITYGTWGAIGIMYHADNPLPSKLTILEDVQIDYIVYIENYQYYKDFVEIIGLEDWLFIQVTEALLGVYYLPEHF